MTLKRHRDTSGREERKRNDTFVRTLRQEYGEKFAPRLPETKELGTVNKRLGLPRDASLNAVRRLYGNK